MMMIGLLCPFLPFSIFRFFNNAPSDSLSLFFSFNLIHHTFFFSFFFSHRLLFSLDSTRDSIQSAYGHLYLSNTVVTIVPSSIVSHSQINSMAPLFKQTLLRRQPSPDQPCTGHDSITLIANSPHPCQEKHSHSTRSTSPSSSSSPALLVFFFFLALNCLSSSLRSSLPSSISTSSGLATFSILQPCLAARNINPNQRVDAPSPGSYPPLEGPDFAFTPHTPLGNLHDPREYADGALATQKLVAARLIPVDRQLWPGVDTRAVYFGNNFGGEKIANVSQLLQAGMRRLVLDLWWDSADLGWQLCPRIKRNGAQLSTVRLALENMEMTDELQLKGMGLPDSQVLRAQDLPDREPLGALDTFSKVSGTPKVERRSEKEETPKVTNGKKSTKEPAPTDPIPEWYLRRRPHHRSPPIRPKAMGGRHHKSPPPPTPINRVATEPHRGGMISAYDKATSSDQTVDGITCSTGEDIDMLLQTLKSWTQQSTEDELEDVFVLILNLNELTNTSLGSRTPSTPTPPSNQTTAAPMLSNEEYFSMLQSPNTNHTIKAALPNTISLKQLFMNVFSSEIYTPIRLEEDRQDLFASWWKAGLVGLDYYNTTVDPVTGRTQTAKGWPTSFFLTETIERRIMVGIGANNLKLNTTYNITDDFTTIYPPGVLGSMANSSLIKVTSSLNRDKCNFPMPGMMMMPTGQEENITWIQDQKNNLTESITTELSWSFASMSDSNSAPWTFSTGQLAVSVCDL